LIAVKTEQKLSSVKTISDAALATSVPAIPIANPTSALFKAGASFVPSPVTATTLSYSLRPVTNKYLSSGEDLAKTFNFFATSLNARLLPTVSIIFSFLSSEGSSFLTIPPTVSLNYLPVMHKYPSSLFLRSS